MGAQSKTQAIARRALGLPDDVVLEDAGREVQATLGAKLLVESARPSLGAHELLGAVFLHCRSDAIQITRFIFVSE